MYGMCENATHSKLDANRPALDARLYWSFCGMAFKLVKL